MTQSVVGGMDSFAAPMELINSPVPRLEHLLFELHFFDIVKGFEVDKHVIGIYSGIGGLLRQGERDRLLTRTDEMFLMVERLSKIPAFAGLGKSAELDPFIHRNLRFVPCSIDPELARPDPERQLPGGRIRFSA